MNILDSIEIGNLIEVDDYYEDDDHVLFIVIDKFRVNEPHEINKKINELILYDASEKQSCRYVREVSVIHWCRENTARVLA